MAPLARPLQGFTTHPMAKPQWTWGPASKAGCVRVCRCSLCSRNVSAAFGVDLEREREKKRK